MGGPSTPRQGGATFQRILVGDDDPGILRFVREKLERAGYEVFAAGRLRSDRFGKASERKEPQCPLP